MCSYCLDFLNTVFDSLKWIKFYGVKLAYCFNRLGKFWVADICANCVGDVWVADLCAKSLKLINDLMGDTIFKGNCSQMDKHGKTKKN